MLYARFMASDHHEFTVGKDSARSPFSCGVLPGKLESHEPFHSGSKQEARGKGQVFDRQLRYLAEGSGFPRNVQNAPPSSPSTSRRISSSSRRQPARSKSVYLSPSTLAIIVRE